MKYVQCTNELNIAYGHGFNVYRLLTISFTREPKKKTIAPEYGTPNSQNELNIVSHLIVNYSY